MAGNAFGKLFSQLQLTEKVMERLLVVLWMDAHPISNLMKMIFNLI